MTFVLIPTNQKYFFETCLKYLTQMKKTLSSYLERAHKHRHFREMLEIHIVSSGLRKLIT